MSMSILWFEMSVTALADSMLFPADREAIDDYCGSNKFFPFRDAEDYERNAGPIGNPEFYPERSRNEFRDIVASRVAEHMAALKAIAD